MKYERTDSFKRDYRNLSKDEREQFRRVVRDEFIPALEGYVGDPARGWPPRLRVKGVQGAPGVWELTWSFTDPDGRASWEWIKVGEETGIRWRRVGSHAIFREP